jgi:hypothetical protein
MPLSTSPPGCPFLVVGFTQSSLMHFINTAVQSSNPTQRMAPSNGGGNQVEFRVWGWVRLSSFGYECSPRNRSLAELQIKTSGS